jgi:3',5'-cyclic AMP phosphodiesterase CpdA
MVKFQIASDLHIEFRNEHYVVASEYITPNADVLILAGDIGNLYKYNQLQRFLEDVSKLFQYVLYVPGNHEYYRVNGVPEVSFRTLTERLLKLEASIDNLYILNGGSVVIDDVCIAGCTLWTNPQVEKIPHYIVRIKGMNKVDIYRNTHLKDLRFVDRTIKYCKEKNQKLLLVTHHCPTFRTTKGKKDDDMYVSLYATDLENRLRGDYVHTSVCGHVHKNFDFMSTQGTRVVGNQKGKPRDNLTDYRPDMIIEV